MVGFISETAIEYRSSPIVADYGGDGRLRAVDRLPDLIRSGVGFRGSLESRAGICAYAQQDGLK